MQSNANQSNAMQKKKRKAKEKEQQEDHDNDMAMIVLAGPAARSRKKPQRAEDHGKGDHVKKNFDFGAAKFLYKPGKLQANGKMSQPSWQCTCPLGRTAHRSKLNKKTLCTRTLPFTDNEQDVLRSLKYWAAL